jgi:hypothetical protein
VQRACQAKSQEVCTTLQQDYEAKISVLSAQLAAADAAIEGCVPSKKISFLVVGAWVRGCVCMCLRLYVPARVRGTC